MDSVVQDKRLLLGQGPTEGPSVEGAREMFAYLCQYLTSLQAEVCLQPSCLRLHNSMSLLLPSLETSIHQTCMSVLVIVFDPNITAQHLCILQDLVQRLACQQDLCHRSMDCPAVAERLFER